MSADLFSVNGETSDYVETAENVPASPIPTPILDVSPDRGLFLRLVNHVAKGESIGIPLYMKLRDSAGNDLPPTTAVFLAVKRNGDELPVRVSEKRGNISFWTSNDITTQRDVDNVDGSKIVLSDGQQARDALNVRDVDDLFLMVDGPTAIDHANSEIYVDSSAVQQGER